jgi:hypothetical protein
MTDGNYVMVSSQRKPPKHVWVKRLLFRLHLRNQYPIKLGGGYWGNIIRTDMVSSNIRPDIERIKHD